MTDQFNEISSYLETWYRSERGRYLLACLQARIDHCLETAFGYHILQTGPVRSGALFGECRIQHRIHAGERPGEGIGLLCQGDELPLESDSIDVIIAHHALEFSPNPHQVLRELQRVLTPQGQLLLTGWNPYSAQGLLKRVRGLAPHSPWRAHSPVSLRRLVDWLNLLGCELESAEYLDQLPQPGSGRVRATLQGMDQWCTRHRLPFGGLYLVQAIKQVAGSQQPRILRRKERFIGLGVARPVSAPGAAPGLPQTGAAPRNQGKPVLH